jgi:hypothetical protein
MSGGWIIGEAVRRIKRGEALICYDSGNNKRSL